MGHRAIPKTRSKSKCKSYSLPIKESSPFSRFELLYLKTSNKFPSSADAHLLVPHLHQNILSSPPSVKIAQCCFPWLHYLDKSTLSQLPASSAPSYASNDLTELLHSGNYYSLLRTVSINCGQYHPSYLPHLHFAVGYSFYKLKVYPQARHHFSVCTSIATRNEDVSYCYFYFGKISYKLKSYRKAAKHYRTAALYHGKRISTNDSSFAKTFDLQQPSHSSLHIYSSSSFRQANRPRQALHESTQALKFAKTEEEYMKAHYESGKLYKLMANHVSALEDYKKVTEHAQKLKNHILIMTAYKDSCSSCIVLDQKDDALSFFNKALLSVELATDSYLPTIDDLKWVCETIGLLPICEATQRLPRTYISMLLNCPELTSCQFKAELEKVYYSFHQVPTNDTATDNNSQTVVCLEEGRSEIPAQYFDDTFSKDELIDKSSVVPFVAYVEIPTPTTCTLCHGLGTVDDGDNHEFVVPANFLDDLWVFPSIPDPYL